MFLLENNVNANASLGIELARSLQLPLQPSNNTAYF